MQDLHVALYIKPSQQSGGSVSLLGEGDGATGIRVVVLTIGADDGATEVGALVVVVYTDVELPMVAFGDVAFPVV